MTSNDSHGVERVKVKTNFDDIFNVIIHLCNIFFQPFRNVDNCKPENVIFIFVPIFEA